MLIDYGTRVRDVTTAKPGSRRVFERWGIDYCCGGGRTIAEACARGALPLEDVLESLRAETDRTSLEVDWRSHSPIELVAYLVATHHEFTHRELERAERLAEKVAGVHGARCPELVELASLVVELRDDLVPHMAKEEHVLFPWIRQQFGASEASLPFPGGSAIVHPIRCMELDHETAGELLARIRRVAGGFVPPEDACGSHRALLECLAELEADLHVHIHLENDVLFPAVREAVLVDGARGVDA